MKEIELSKTGKKNKGKYKALIDEDVFDIVNKFNWTYNNGYAIRYDYSTDKQKTIHLHRFIYELKYGEIPEGIFIDHIDQNKLNNQISNLRLANNSENQCNTTKNKNNKSGYKGIFKYVRREKRKDKSIYMKEYWHAKITKDGKRYTKKFPYNAEGLELAKEWIKKMSLNVQGEFSIYNRPDENK